MGALLEPDEVEHLTGYRRPTYQRRWLAEHGIAHRVNARGQVVVTRSALDGGVDERAASPRWETVR